MLNNLTNFFNLITGRRIKTQLENDDLIAIGTKQSPALGDYKPTAIKFEDLQAQVGGLQTVAVDGITITGNGTSASPLVSNSLPIRGALVGGGILISTWEESGVKKGLIASLTNLSTALPYTIPSRQSTLIGPTAQSNNNGLGNTNAIIAQTSAPATTAYAAGIARLYLGGGYTDWYLPTNYELYLCYEAAFVVNKILGVNGFTNNFYWASTEFTNTSGWYQGFNSGSQFYFGANAKSNNYYVRAVRIHTF